MNRHGWEQPSDICSVSKDITKKKKKDAFSPQASFSSSDPD